jgi:hypothetical protein
VHPTNAPSNAPTGSPTENPSQAPTKSPTAVPATAPTRSPSLFPTKLPTQDRAVPCLGSGTTLWIRSPKTSVPIRQLVNNTAVCLDHPYNVEVRPCNGTPSLDRPVRIRLVSSGAVVHHSPPQRVSPFYLFGSSAAHSSPRALPNGVYYIDYPSIPPPSSATGTAVKFTQSCPGPKGQKGMKGCMKKR